MRRVLIVGCNGLLGQKLSVVASRHWTVYGAGRHVSSPVQAFLKEYVQMDITAGQAVHERMKDLSPEWVVNAAAMTDVDECEINPELAWAVNVEGVRHLAEACRQQGAGLLHISTNYVFDGHSGPYAESDEPNPINVYGRTKLEAERLIRESGLEHLIIRTVLLYGSVPAPRPNYVDSVCSGLKRGEPVRAATDLWANPSLIDDVARGIEAAIEGDARGIFHMAGGESLCRYEMAQRVAEVFGLDASLIEPVETGELGLKARRPLRSGLLTDRAGMELGWAGAAVEPGLRTMRDQMEANAKGRCL